MITNFFALLTLVILTVTQPLLAYAQESDFCPRHMWSGGYGFGWVFGLFILFLMIAAATKLIFYRQCGGAHHHCGLCHKMDRQRGYGTWSDSTSSSLQILNERLAKGEIQKEEYEDKKATILSGQR